MKPSPSTNCCDDGSTLNVRGDQEDDHHRQQQTAQQHQPQHRVFDSSNLVHAIDQKTSKQQAWFQQPPSASKDSLSQHAGNEAYIESQVLRLTDECRLFREGNEEANTIETKNSPALFHRHEIQTSWNKLGNGAFSEVYTIQKLFLVDKGFVDPQQKQSREFLRDKCASGREQGLEERMQCLHLEGVCSGEISQSGPSQQYVIKHLRRDLMADRKRFIHAAGDLVMEAMYLSKFNHPNIIKLRGCAVGGSSAYGSGKHDGFFLILDRLNATLSQRIEEWKQKGGVREQQMIYSNRLVDFQEKLEIAHQIASALAYLHGKDFVYRDLKPDNVGLLNVGPGKKPVVQLFDFGLCREIPEAAPPEDKVFRMSGVGTRRYMSPEVYLGQNYNVKADVYSWAIVLHSMITLQRPFEMYDAPLHKLLVCQEGIRPTIYQQWPRPIQELLSRGWAVQPNDRLSMTEVCLFIEGLFEDLGTKQYHETPSKEEISSCDVASSNSISNIEDCRDSSFGQDFTSTLPESKTCTRDTVENSIACFMEEWTALLCSGTSCTNTDPNSPQTKKTPTKKSLLRTLEAHMMTEVAGAQLLMLQDRNNPSYRDRLGTTDYPHLKRLRSSYL